MGIYSGAATLSILLIGEDERKEIERVKAYARAHPLTLDIMKRSKIDNGTTFLSLEERRRQPTGFIRPKSATMLIPQGYRAALSVEEQPIGLCWHLSISVQGRAKKGMMPSDEAVKMIAEEFGVSYPPDKGWIEEYQPGEYAINLVSLIAPVAEGHA